jgi:hypothetical protein
VGEGAGGAVGVGFGVGVVVEPEEALTAPPPQPATIDRREKNSTQHTTFGPMGNNLLHTAILDATELLDVVFSSVFQPVKFSPKRKTGHSTAGL